jgi:carboxylate-amine ligase
VLTQPELLEENRFIATRDGMDARMLDPVREALVPARLQLDMLLEACAPHAHALGCVDELLSVRALAEGTGAARQLELSRGDDGLPGVVATLADLFTSDAVAGPEGEPVPGPGLETAAAEA